MRSGLEAVEKGLVMMDSGLSTTGLGFRSVSMGDDFRPGDGDSVGMCDGLRGVGVGEGGSDLPSCSSSEEDEAACRVMGLSFDLLMNRGMREGESFT